MPVLSSPFPQVLLYYLCASTVTVGESTSKEWCKKEEEKKRKEKAEHKLKNLISCGDLEGKMPATFFALS